RRLVDECALQGDRETLQSVCCRAPVAVARPAAPVWGFCALATGVVARRRARQAARLLAPSACGCRPSAGAARRSGPPGCTDCTRCDPETGVVKRLERSTEGGGPCGERDVVHDLAGRVSNAAVALHRPRRSRDRLSSCWPQ